MSEDKLLFKNKTIIVTGASSDIGRSVALHLLAEGANLILHTSGKDSETELKLFFKNIKGISYFSFDFSGTDDVENAYSAAGFGDVAIDGMVHCVGLRSRRPLNMIKRDHVKEVIQVNFISFLEMVKTITKKNRFNTGLSIVTISSISSVSGGLGVTVYAASKAAVDAAVRCLAKELAPKGIRLNSILCGQVNSEAYHKLIRSKSDQNDHILDRQFLGLIEPDNISKTVVFLLSKQASFISGAMIPVDGGYLT